MPTPQEFYDDDLYLIANKSAFSAFPQEFYDDDLYLIANKSAVSALLSNFVF
jgi:hypothetical protein